MDNRLDYVRRPSPPLKPADNPQPRPTNGKKCASSNHLQKSLSQISHHPRPTPAKIATVFGDSSITASAQRHRLSVPGCGKTLPREIVCQGTTLQAAEKLLRAVGRDFSPGIRLMESARALAPEVCFLRLPVGDPEFFRILFSRAVGAPSSAGL